MRNTETCGSAGWFARIWVDPDRNTRSLSYFKRRRLRAYKRLLFFYFFSFFFLNLERETLNSFSKAIPGGLVPPWPSPNVVVCRWDSGKIKTPSYRFGSPLSRSVFLFVQIWVFVYESWNVRFDFFKNVFFFSCFDCVAESLSRATTLFLFVGWVEF